MASTSTGAPKTFSTFDEMKVADLKVELKKRNLPVSGPKPQLIERLRPFADSVLTPATPTTDTASPNLSSPPILTPIQNISTVVKVENLKMEPHVKIEPAIKLEPVTQHEEKMNTGSPPISPTHPDPTITPMSPDVMDIQSPSSITRGVLKNQFSSSQGSIPMLVDQISRPPSAAPMEIAPMETDQTTSIINSVTDFTQSLPPGFKAFTAVAQPMPLTGPLLNNQQVSPKSPQDQPRQLTQEELLRQQQKKIEELQRQLQQSQLQLKIHQEQQRLLQQQKLLQQQVQQHQQQLAKHQTLQKLQLQKQQQQKQQLQQQVSKPAPHVQSPPAIQTQPGSQTPTPVQQPAQSQAPPTPQSPPQAVSTIQISIVDSSNVPQVHRGVSGTQQIQIPVHLLQAGQAMQNCTNSLPPVIVSSNPNSPTKQTKVSSPQSQNVTVPDLNLGKPVVSFASPPPHGQPFIFTSTVDSSTKTASEAMPPNGITRTASLPGSPLDGQSVSRSASTPYFSVPMKEPPKYDEAIKSKQHQNQSQNPPFVMLDSPLSSNSPNSLKSQAIDDVLEILIRHGELPPSAAQEPPPTPKTTNSSGTVPVTSSSMSLSNDTGLGSGSPKYSQFSPLSADPGMSPVGTLHTPVASPVSVGHREPSPQPFLISPPQSNENPTHELSLSEQDGLPPHLDLDFANMDWSSDPVLGLDLADSAGLTVDPSKFMLDDGRTLSVPISCGGMSPQRGGSSHGSEPDMTALGLHDPDSNNHMQMDVSDWLDVIMPSTGLTPLSTNAPVSFPSDPILTPKTQQEVLDLFNFDESELCEPHGSGGINWDSIVEPSTSSS